MKKAELALIQAKRQGGGRARVIAFLHEALTPSGDRRFREARRRFAQRDRERPFDVFYQPIIRLGNNGSPASRRCCAGIIR